MIKSGSLLACFLLFLSACVLRKSDDSSCVKVDPGVDVAYEVTGQKLPAVVKIYNKSRVSEGAASQCTATIVSKNTIIFAAHCAADSPGSPPPLICIQSGANLGLCTKKVFRTELQAQDDTGLYRNDAAVAIFDDASFQNFMRFHNKLFNSVGSKIYFVGFSPMQAGINSKDYDYKRWGANTVTKMIANDSVIESTPNGTLEHSAIGYGDSGGPLLQNCELIGVASQGDMNQETRKTITNYHSNLTTAENIAWLQQQKSNGAYICGLYGDDPAFCPSDGLAMPVADPGTDKAGNPKFPCTEKFEPDPPKNGC